MQTSILTKFHNLCKLKIQLLSEDLEKIATFFLLLAFGRFVSSFNLKYENVTMVKSFIMS